MFDIKQRKCLSNIITVYSRQVNTIKKT